MNKTCGSCTMCCKLVSVPEMKKPIYVWCENCSPKTGCQIYHDRPPSCHRFECVWIIEGDLPGNIRPDRCKVMFEQFPGSSTILAMVDPAFPDNWRKKNIIDQIQLFVRRGCAVVVTNGREKHILLPKDKTAQEVMADIQLASSIVGV